MSDLTGVYADIPRPELLEQYKSSGRLTALVNLLWASMGELAQPLHDIGTGFSLTSSTGDQLDIIGAVFAVDRQGRTDEQYRQAIYTKIAYQGHGTVDEILVACRLVFGGVNMEYLPELPAKFFIWLQDATGDTSFANSFLNRIAPAGVQAMHGVNLVTATNPQPIHTATTNERIFVVKQDTV